MMSAQLPILHVQVTGKDDLIAKAISDRGLDRSVYDFIKHNWGEAAANVAMLTAEQRWPEAIDAAPAANPPEVEWTPQERERYRYLGVDGPE